MNRGAILLPNPPSISIPLVLPRLVTLRLYGMKPNVLEVINLICMSSALYDVVIRFGANPSFTVPEFSGILETGLVVHYE